MGVEVKYYPGNSNRLSENDFLTGPILKFAEIIKSYTQNYATGVEEKFDVPYFYNERATLSVLAGGIWRADPDNLVIEEYSTLKDKEDGPFKGRRDIWFLSGGVECRAEAKQRFRDLGSFTKSNAEKLVNLVLDEAKPTHITSSRDKEYKQVGILFIIPKIKADNNSYQTLSGKYDALITEVLAAAAEASKGHFLRASYWDESIVEKKHHYFDSKGIKYYYPGVDTIFCLKGSS